MNSKSVPSSSKSETHPATMTREELMAELAALRRESRTKEVDAAKLEIKAKLKAMGK